MNELYVKKTGGTHYGYVIVLCCFLIMFVIVGLVMSCAGIFYKPVSGELGVDIGRFGLYMSLNFLSSTLMLSVAGRLIERYSARWILSGSSAVIAVSFMLMSQFQALWQFYVVGVVFGISLSFLLYLGFPTLLNRWFKARMGLFIGICSAGSGIGGVLFNPLAGHLIAQYGWRTTYFLFGMAILLLVAPVLALFLRDYPEDKGLSAYGASSVVENNKPSETFGTAKDISYKEALHMPIFYGLIVFAFLMNATATLNIFIPAYMQSADFSVEQASLVASAAMVGVTVGKVLLGMINDRSALLGVFTTIGLGIAGLLLMLMNHAGLLFAIGGGFLFGWAYAGVTVQTPMLVRSVFGVGSYAQIYSNVSMAIAVGGAVAAGGWGLLSDVTSFRFIFATGATFLMLSGAIGMYAVCKYKAMVPTDKKP